LTQAVREQVEASVVDVGAVAATLEPPQGSSADLRERLAGEEDPVRQHMGKVMKSFEQGLFAGGQAAAEIQDNLELERWFRNPKGHERRIHGHRHAGVPIVQEGPTLLLALDAHLQHPHPFAVADLYPYRAAKPPQCQQDVMARRKVMRKARSRKNRPVLFAELEAPYPHLF